MYLIIQQSFLAIHTPSSTESLDIYYELLN